MRLNDTFFTLAFIAAHFGSAAAKGCPYSVRRYDKEVKWDIVEAGKSHIRVIDGYPATISADQDCKLKIKGLARLKYTIAPGDSSTIKPKRGCTAPRVT